MQLENPKFDIASQTKLPCHVKRLNNQPLQAQRCGYTSCSQALSQTDRDLNPGPLKHQSELLLPNSVINLLTSIFLLTFPSLMIIDPFFSCAIMTGNINFWSSKSIPMMSRSRRNAVWVEWRESKVRNV
jgi:hypothetical protein